MSRIRSVFHLKVLEAVFIELRGPLLCRQEGLFSFCNCLKLTPKCWRLLICWLLFEVKPISGSGVDVHVIFKCLLFFRYKKAALLCHLSQTKELTTKRVCGVTTLLITDSLISCRFNSFLFSYRFILYRCCSFTGFNSAFLQDTILLYVHGLFRSVQY